MAKEKTDDQPLAPVAEQPADAYELPLDEFCTRLSASDKRVEMIGGFHATEKKAGRLKDYETAYAARFAAFQTQPA